MFSDLPGSYFKLILFTLVVIINYYEQVVQYNCTAPLVRNKAYRIFKMHKAKHYMQTDTVGLHTADKHSIMELF